MAARESSDWTVTASADNALATATRAAVPGQRHFVSHVSASFSAAAVGKRLQLKAGTTVVAEWYVHDQFAVDFSRPLVIPIGTAVSAELQASGTAGVLGVVTLAGYTWAG